MKLAWTIALVAGLAACPLAAQVSDPLAKITDPADRAVLAEAASAISGRPPDLARLDAVLAKLPRPTRLRGMVQTARAAALASRNDAGPAIAAIEEALRLLPDDPFAKLVATQLFTFAGSPDRAADLWLQASREAPDLARTSDRYLMSALVDRLAEMGDTIRADRVNARLGEIGYARGLAPERSSAALARVRRDIAAGGIEEATQGVAAIGDPLHLRALYVDRRYEALWPRIAEWAGPSLDAQHRRYLEELRRDWTASGSFEGAAAYARRLVAVGAYPAVTALFLPMFAGSAPERTTLGAEFLAPVVARALTRQGREAEGRALLATVAADLPADDGGNGLNIVGAYITAALEAERWSEVVEQADAFLVRARPLGPAINREALLDVEESRACALWKLGRRSEADAAAARFLIAEAAIPGTSYSYHLCRGDVAAARAMMIRRLADRDSRGWALGALQPRARPPETPFARAIGTVEDSVRAAPDVHAALAKVGRILPQPVLSRLPDGFDPLRVEGPRRPPRPGDV